MGGCGACLVLVLGLMARLSGKVQLSCRNLGVISGAAAGRVMANSDSAVALCSPLKLAHSNSGPAPPPKYLMCTSPIFIYFVTPSFLPIPMRIPPSALLKFTRVPFASSYQF
jgi:hypothetical protein